MAHGAGRQGDRRADRGPARPAPSPSPRWTQLGDAGAVHDRRRPARAHHRQLRRQAAALPRRLDRRAGRQRHRQRPRRGRRAEPLALTLAPDPRGGLDADVLRARGRGDRRPPRAARRRASSRGDTKVVDRGRADKLYHLHHRRSGCADARARLPPRARCASADRDARLGPVGGPRHARSCSRGEFELGADDRVRHAPAVAGGRRAAGGGRAGAALPARRAPAAASRSAAATSSRGASGVAMLVREAAVPRQPRGRRGRGGAARDRPDASPPTRACCVAVAGRRARGRGARGAARRRRGRVRDAAEIGEVKTEPSGMVLVGPRPFGGRRDGPVAGRSASRIC